MILRHFKKTIWPAMVIQLLVCEVFNSSSMSCVSSEVCTLNLQLYIQLMNATVENSVSNCGQ